MIIDHTTRHQCKLEGLLSAVSAEQGSCAVRAVDKQRHEFYAGVLPKQMKDNMMFVYIKVNIIVINISCSHHHT